MTLAVISEPLSDRMCSEIPASRQAIWVDLR